ncbi:UNVERIFIED_ORG: DNA-binding transcriptional regulator YdaS (Cro superfamily) [Burkholderia sp. 1263]
MDLKTYLSGGRGRLTSLSKAIGAHTPDVSRWATGERPIPIPFGLPIEKATKGLVTRREMFPEDTIKKVWPELMRQKNGKVDRLAASDDAQPPVGSADDSKD